MSAKVPPPPPDPVRRPELVASAVALATAVNDQLAREGLPPLPFKAAIRVAVAVLEAPTGTP